MSKVRQLFQSFLISAALCVLTAASSGMANAAEVVKLRVSIIPIIDVAPLFAAITQGYFKAEDLEIDTAPVAGGAQGIPGLVAGAYQIAFSNVVSTLLARQQGLDLRIVAPGSATQAEPPDGAGLVARRGEGIRSGKDLEGKSLAVNTRNNIIWLYAREWIVRTGGDPSKINFREVPFPQMLDTLRGKQVDAAFVVQPMLLGAMESQVFEMVAWPYNAVQPKADVAQYLATAEFIKNNPDVVRRFARALKKGAEWYNANIAADETLALVSSYTRIPPETLKKFGFATAPQTVSTDAIRKTMELMGKHGLLSGPLELDGLLHETAR